MQIKYFLVLFLSLIAPVLRAQDHKISGTMLDSISQLPIPGINLTLTNIKDTTEKQYSVTDREGKFLFSGLKKEIYLFKASYVGYRDVQRIVTIIDTLLRLEKLSMAQRPVVVTGVDVVGEVVLVEQKKDTVQFNAGAFKTNRDATAEELVTKLPGMTIDKTTIKAQGEDVKQVLVDGKPFFGDDPFVALRNLPAEVIDKIQVYDKLSDQAELTGFDDGQSTKTMNVVTRGNQRNSQFGKVFGGYGDNQRYEAGGNINLLSGIRRVSLIGLSNNINQQNFSQQDVLSMGGGSRQNRGGFDLRAGGMGRGGGPRGGGGMPMMGGNLSDFIVGQQNGISTTHSAGINYSDLWFGTVNMSGSYFFNAGKNENDQSSAREYISSSDEQRLYAEKNLSASTNYHHRINMRIEYPIDSSNALIFTPRISFQTNNSDSKTDGLTSLGNIDTISRGSAENAMNSDGNNFSQGLTYRHKFPTEGRTISIDLNTNLNNKSGDGSTMNQSVYRTDSTTQFDSLDQRSTNFTKGYSVASNVTYTEPLVKNGLLQFNYNISFSNSDAEKKTYDFNSADRQYDLLKSDLSTVLNNGYLTQRGGIGYRLRGEEYSGTIGISYQTAALTADYSYPESRSIRKNYQSLLPMAMLTWKLSQSSNLRFFYRTSTTPPSIGQLQDIVDNTNPTLLTAGNSNLRQTYNHTIVTRYNFTSSEHSTTFFALISGTITRDYISNAIIVPGNDTLLSSGIEVKRGAQFTIPVNLNDYRNINSFLMYGLPITLINCNLNLNMGVSYTRTPGLINDRNNFAGTYALSQGIVLSSNISRDLDFTVSHNYNLNYVKNTLQPELNTDYYQHTTAVKFNWTFWEGIVLRSDINHQLYSGYGSQNAEKVIVWNVGLGKKFLSDNSADLSIRVFDVLNKNQKIVRSITESYAEEVRPTVLGRYFLLTFTYTVRNYQL